MWHYAVSETSFGVLLSKHDVLSRIERACELIAHFRIGVTGCLYASLSLSLPLSLMPAYVHLMCIFASHEFAADVLLESSFASCHT